jgi:quercetin dioxygenase-like cupin family protein
VAANK